MGAGGIALPRALVCAKEGACDAGTRDSGDLSLWPGGRGNAFVHAYVELPDSNRFLALMAHENVPDAGGELIGTFLRDGTIPPSI